MPPNWILNEMKGYEMQNDIAAPGEFSYEALFIIVRAWVLSKAPFPVLDINVPDVVNALMKSQSSLSFNMSEDMPPVFSGAAHDHFGRYNETPEMLNRIPELSSAWFAAQVSRLRTEQDMARLQESIRAMLTWMHILEYLELDPDNGYLATQKLMDNQLLVFKK